jgi:tRNA-(ms[2]io[6]A)-hydroxylase
MFLNLARKHGDRELVDKKWELLLQYEAKIMKKLNNHESIHG